MVKDFYIDTTGSMCYDPHWGITFPEEIPMNFFDMIRCFGGGYLLVEPKYGWNNMPDVLTFRMNEENVKPLEKELGWGFHVRDMWPC